MRYSEKEQPADGGILQKILTVISAPTRFLNEIAIKIVFMPRKAIEEVLILAMVIGFITTLIDFLLLKFIGKKGILDGRFPIILRIISLVIILGFYLFYELHEFNIYKQVNTLVELHDVSEASTEDTGIAASLLNDSDLDEEEMKGMTKISLEEDEGDIEPDSDDTIDSEAFAKALHTGNVPLNLTLDKALLNDDIKSSIPSLDDAFPEITITQEIKASDSGIDDTLLSEKQNPTSILQTGAEQSNEEMGMKFVSPDSMPKPKLVKSLANNQDIINYQDKLAICINNLLSAGLTYEGELSSEAITDINSIMDNTEIESEYVLDNDIIESLNTLAQDDAIELVDLEKSWKVPLDAVDMI